MVAPGISVRFEARKAIKTLGRLRTALGRGARQISGFELQQIKSILASRTRNTFKARSNDPTRWKDVSIPQAAWGRSRDVLGLRVGTIDLIKAQLRQRGGGRGGVLPVRDTQTLFRGVTDPNDKNFTFRIANRNAIIFGTKVPYARKHLFRGTGAFKFGPTQEQRLRRRVPPPGKKKGRARQQVFGRKKGAQERPYYVLRGWARKTYPRTAQIPIRSWLRPFSAGETKKIGEIIEAMLTRAIQRNA